MPPRRKGGFNFFAGLGETKKKETGGRKGAKGKNAAKPKKVVHPEIAELKMLRRQVKEIESLEMSMHQLKPFQKQKIAKKPQIRKRILELEDLHPQCKPPVRKGGQRQKPESKFGIPYTQQAQQKPKATVIVLESKSRPTPQQQLKNLTAKSARARTGNKEKVSEEINCDSFTGVKKRLKAIKKSLKKIEGYERQVGLGQVLAKGEKAILETKPELEAEQKTLKKKRQKMLEEGLLTQAEKDSLLEKVRKQIISCNDIEEKLMIGGKLTNDEKKILDSKKCYMKEFAHLNSVVPIQVRTAAKVATKKPTTLGDFPKEIQNRLFAIDMELSKIKYEREEAKKLEIRFNKRGGKPLTPKEVRMVNRIESMGKKIEKLETEQETLIREHS